MKHLGDIGARIRDCSTYNFGMHNANKLAHEDAPRLVKALEAVLELCEIAETPMMGSRTLMIHPDAIRDMINDAFKVGK